jgi:DNA-binding response OmpR family regulator
MQAQYDSVTVALSYLVAVVAGMDDYLTKPIDRDKLAACLEHYLRHKAGGEQSSLDQFRS